MQLIINFVHKFNSVIHSNFNYFHYFNHQKFFSKHLNFLKCLYQKKEIYSFSFTEASSHLLTKYAKSRLEISHFNHNHLILSRLSNKTLYIFSSEFNAIC